MGEAIIQAFGADIGAPFKGFHGVDLLSQGDEFIFQVLDLLWGGAVLEFKQDNVAIRRLSSRGGGHEKKGGGQGE